MKKEATVKIVWDPQGPGVERTLKLRIIFDRKTYYRAINNKTKMTEDDFNSANKKAVKSAIKSAEAAKMQAEAICEELGENFTIQEFSYQYKKQVFGKDDRTRSKNTLRNIFEIYCAENELAQNTLINYTSAVNWVERFRPDCLITEISPSFILALKAFMHTQNNQRCGKDMSENTIRMYFRGLKAICQFAVDKHILSTNPFNGQHLDSGDRPRTALTEDEWAAFMQYQPTVGTQEEFAHDMAIMNFCLGGPNFADVLRWTNDCIQSGNIVYLRKKSEKRGKPQVVCVALVEEAERVLRKYGCIDASRPRAYILPYYSGAISAKARNQRRDGVLKRINGGIKTICKALNIAPFTTYNIRHTYSIYARDKGGLSSSQIQRMLGHKSINTTERYLSGITATLDKKHADFVNTMLKGGVE